ncbi:MAG: MerR family transcriptional regulator [Cyclobacteriaceae bacterium]
MSVIINPLMTNKYSIKDLENLSGIKAHTLRIWEQRYDFIKPKRTATNIRYYNSEDLKLILNVALLRERGLKISKIAAMSKDNLHQAVLTQINEELDYDSQIHSLTMAMIDLDEQAYEKTLSTCILQLGLEKTMNNIVYPFLIKIGFLWQANAIHPAQEHFITCLIRQKLIVAIDGQKGNFDQVADKYILFLPDGELHEISLLYAHFLLKARGHQVVYLGQSLPFEDVEMAYDVHRPEYIFTIMTSFPKKRNAQKFVSRLSESFPDSTIFISGYRALHTPLDIPSNVILIRKIEELFSFLDSRPEARATA